MRDPWREKDTHDDVLPVAWDVEDEEDPDERPADQRDDDD